ncbi:hypothetical protein NVP2275O_222 [Vibrio phage 2.275.O._10N.286.54.E11]|nr:hypothetical protein NVP2275O_222 [Vibrio phage 2.275.O._10N.286.54.E11]
MIGRNITPAHRGVYIYEEVDDKTVIIELKNQFYRGDLFDWLNSIECFAQTIRDYEQPIMHEKEDRDKLGIWKRFRVTELIEIKGYDVVTLVMLGL